MVQCHSPSGIATRSSKSTACPLRHGKPRTERSSRTVSTVEPFDAADTTRAAAARWASRARKFTSSQSQEPRVDPAGPPKAYALLSGLNRKARDGYMLL